MDLGRVGVVRHHTLSQPALPGARLRSQDVAGKRMVTLDFAGARLLEPLGRAFMSLQLGHNKSTAHDNHTAHNATIRLCAPVAESSLR